MPDKKKRIAKPTCDCVTHGCAHFGRGFCRVMIPEGKCVMNVPLYHYKCCPFLNSEQGLAALKIYCESRGIPFKDVSP